MVPLLPVSSLLDADAFFPSLASQSLFEAPCPPGPPAPPPSLIPTPPLDLLTPSRLPTLTPPPHPSTLLLRVAMSPLPLPSPRRPSHSELAIRPRPKPFETFPLRAARLPTYPTPSLPTVWGCVHPSPRPAFVQERSEEASSRLSEGGGARVEGRDPRTSREGAIRARALR